MSGFPRLLSVLSALSAARPLDRPTSDAWVPGRRTARGLALLPLLPLLAGTSACAVQLDLLDAQVTEEGAVVMSFSARQSVGGRPVADLDRDDFLVTEDGEEVSFFEADVVVQNAGAGFDIEAVLLLDTSGSLVNGDDLADLKAAVEGWVEALGRSEQELAIYRFDGGASIYAHTTFSDDASYIAGSVDSISEHCAEIGVPTDDCDPSTNLNGAILQALELLDERALASDRPIYRGSVVVFTDGTDRARRVAAEDVLAGVRATPHAVYTIGLGNEIDPAFLREVGKDGFRLSRNLDDIADAFDEVAELVVEEAGGVYSLIYCSPSRAGAHSVDLTPKGAPRRGISHPFDASNFSGQCDAEEIAAR